MDFDQVLAVVSHALFGAIVGVMTTVMLIFIAKVSFSLHYSSEDMNALGKKYDFVLFL
jgi:hypothetical protein